MATSIKFGYFAQNQLEFYVSIKHRLQHLSQLVPKASEQSQRDFLDSFGFRGNKITEQTARFPGGIKCA